MWEGRVWQSNARSMSVGSRVQGKGGHVCNHFVTIQWSWLHSRFFGGYQGKRAAFQILAQKGDTGRQKPKPEMTRNGLPRRTSMIWGRAWGDGGRGRLISVWIKLHLNLKEWSDLGFVYFGLCIHDLKFWKTNANNGRNTDSDAAISAIKSNRVEQTRVPALIALSWIDMLVTNHLSPTSVFHLKKKTWNSYLKSWCDHEIQYLRWECLEKYKPFNK